MNTFLRWSSGIVAALCLPLLSGCNDGQKHSEDDDGVPFSTEGVSGHYQLTLVFQDGTSRQESLVLLDDDNQVSGKSSLGNVTGSVQKTRVRLVLTGESVWTLNGEFRNDAIAGTFTSTDPDPLRQKGSFVADP